MYESVYKNKGFFIGRYETGAKLERVDELDTSNQGEQNEIFVQKGLNVYNYVPWGNNMISTEPYEGIIGAVELSRNFAKKIIICLLKAHCVMVYNGMPFYNI